MSAHPDNGATQGTVPPPHTTPPAGEEWVTLREAAALAGVSVSAIRKWYSSGLRSRLVSGPNGKQREVPRAEVLARARRREEQAPAGRSTVAAERGLIPVSTFEALQAAYLLAQEGRLSAEVRARTAEFHLGRTEEELARLREELARARRRWWQRKA